MGNSFTTNSTIEKPSGLAHALSCAGPLLGLFLLQAGGNTAQRKNSKRMLIEIDDGYLKWLKEENPDLFISGQDEKAVFTEYVNEVLASHRNSWSQDSDPAS